MNYEYWFANIPGLTNYARLSLVAQAGSARELYFLPERQLKSLGAEEKVTEAVIAGRKMDTERAYTALCGDGISFISIEDSAYPARLKTIPDAPYGIYAKGPLPDGKEKHVAIVGARMCSEYGRAVATELGRQLASLGACVVSGMARGIDSAAHEGALLADGVTCAVLGCGVDVCYPKSAGQIYRQILNRGCILSEYPPNTPPLAAYFPQRNRIISGMSDLVVVVEAKERSGSLITADCALEQGRDIYAVPGRLFDKLSAGCNDLIRQGAGILSNIDEFIQELDLCGARGMSVEHLEKILLEKQERLVYSCVDLRPKSIEELLAETELLLPDLAQILAGLSQKGFITEVFKNRYIRHI